MDGVNPDSGTTVFADRAQRSTPSTPAHQGLNGFLPRPSRLAGVDVARGVAVIGMYAVHVGPEPAKGGIGVLFRPFEGHSAALFAVLAGVSIALMSGGRRPKTGWAQITVSLRLLTRSPLLIALGLFLTWLDTGFLVILAYYGACFVFALPFLRLRAGALAVAAAVFAIGMPLVSYLLRSSLAPRDLLFLPPDLLPEQFTSATGLGQVLSILLLTGTFPALNLMTYILAGMAVGRLDLSSDRVCRRLLGGGALLAALSYGVSWVATELLGGMERIYQALGPAAAQAGIGPEEFFELNKTFIHGTPPTTSWSWELLATGNSYTPFDFLGSIGVAAVVIGAAQLLARRYPSPLRPLADLGSVILSAYVLHLVVLRIFWHHDPSVYGVLHFLEFCAVALVAAVAWRRWVGRGPLEWLMHVLSRWPDRLVRAVRSVRAARSEVRVPEQASH